MSAIRFDESTPANHPLHPAKSRVADFMAHLGLVVAIGFGCVLPAAAAFLNS
jgi:hypothetical protein